MASWQSGNVPEVDQLRVRLVGWQSGIVPEVDQLLVRLVSWQDWLNRNLFTGLSSSELLVGREAVVGGHGG